MEGPGGYQFVGRTLQMWNRYRQTPEFDKPWLLRFFDQIRFYPVSEQELLEIRQQFPHGRYPLKIEQSNFNLREYQQFLDSNSEDILSFTRLREQAFSTELDNWVKSGQINFENTQVAPIVDDAGALGKDCLSIDSPVSGNIWQLKRQVGDQVEAGSVVAVLESMKMEVEVLAPEDGVVKTIIKSEGQQVATGQAIMVLQSKAEDSNE